MMMSEQIFLGTEGWDTLVDHMLTKGPWMCRVDSARCGILMEREDNDKQHYLWSSDSHGETPTCRESKIREKSKALEVAVF